MYAGTGVDQTIRNGIELGGGTLLVDKIAWDTNAGGITVGTLRGAEAGDWIAGIAVSTSANAASVFASGAFSGEVPLTSQSTDQTGYVNSVHLLKVPSAGDIEISSAGIYGATFVLIRGASEIVPKTPVTSGQFASIQDPSYDSDG